MRRVYASMLALALGAGAATLAPDALARPPVVTIGIGFPVPGLVPALAVVPGPYYYAPAYYGPVIGYGYYGRGYGYYGAHGYRHGYWHR